MTGLVAGIGFRRETGADEIVALVVQALDAIGASQDRLSALATAEDRAGDHGAIGAAAALGIPLLGIGEADMLAADDRVQTRSARIEASRGVGSVAEAAALAASGEEGRLVLPRIASSCATCALAMPRVSGQSRLP